MNDKLQMPFLVSIIRSNRVFEQIIIFQGSSDMDHSHVNGAINLTTITSSTSPSESPNETPTYQSDYEPRTEEQVSLFLILDI